MKLLSFSADRLSPRSLFRPAMLRQLFALALASTTLATAASPQDAEVRAARGVMKRRISSQQQFLVERLQSDPDVGATAEEQFSWMDRAQRVYAERVRGERPSRVESFSPYVWSWMPMLVTEGNPTDELTHRVHIDRVLPSLLADLEAVVDELEAGAPELLRIPDLGNGLGRAQLLERCEEPLLARFQSAIERLPTVVDDWRRSSALQGGAVPNHLDSAVAQLTRYGRLIDVELGIRDGRLEVAHARLAALTSPGDPPSGFESLVRRIALAYRDAGRSGAALAVLDLGLLSTTEGTWPAADLRALYETCAGRAGVRRFELVLVLRAAPLVPTSIRFDPSSLVDIETGEPLDLDALDGKSLVLDFMQLRCGPCLAAVPTLQRFDENHPEIRVLAIAVDTLEDQPATLVATRERGGLYPVLRDTANWAEELGVYGFPSYVVVTPERVVLRPFGRGTEPTHSLEDVVATLVPGGWEGWDEAR